MNTGWRRFGPHLVGWCGFTTAILWCIWAAGATAKHIYIPVIVGSHIGFAIYIEWTEFRGWLQSKNKLTLDLLSKVLGVLLAGAFWVFWK